MNIRSLFTVFSFLSLTSLTCLQGQSALPYSSGFEPSSGYPLGPLGSNGDWAGSTGTEVSSAAAYSGTQGIALAAGAAENLTATFSATVGSVVFVEVYVRPAVDSSGSSLLEVPGVLSLDFVDSSGLGELRVAGGAGDFMGTGTTFSVTGGQADAFQHVVLRLDYSAEVSDVWFNGSLLAIGLPFSTSAPSAFSGVLFSNPGAQPAYFDDFSAGYANPLYTDADSDGLSASWELANGGDDTDPSDRSLELDGDGLTQIEEFAHGTATNTADTDSDAALDGTEADLGTDPLTAESFQTLASDGNGGLGTSIDFETAQSYNLGTLDGQNGWSASAASVTVTAAQSSSGTQAIELALDSNDPAAPVTAERLFGVGEEKQLWITFYAKIQPGGVPDVSTLDGPTAVLLGVSSNEKLIVYNSSVGKWLFSAETYTGIGDAFQKFSVYLDYDSQTAKVVLNNVLVFNEIPFADPDLVTFSRFQARLTGDETGAQAPAYTDKLTVSTEEDPEIDFDADLLKNWEERNLGTDLYSADSDQDLIDDKYEVDHQLNPLDALDASLDPDGDNLSTLLEYQWGFNPHAADTEGVSGIVNWDHWQNLRSLQPEVAFLTESHRYPYNPTFKSFLKQLETGTDLGHSYGSRIRGYIVPQVTGDYTFQISSTDNSELWLSTDGSTVKRSLVAWVSSPTGFRDWDDSATQQSALITLQAGQRYYVEVLHRANGGYNHHLSVAWTGPGVNQEVVGETYLESLVPNPEDLDEDELLDSWETAHNISTTSGKNHAGYWGDPDGDLVINYIEQLYGTDPRSADTDSDGESDYAEIYLSLTDPLVADFDGTVTTEATLSGSSYVASSGSWLTEANAVYAQSLRGWLEYDLSVVTAGFYALSIEGLDHNSLSGQDSFELELSVDGVSIGTGNLAIDSATGVGAVRFYLPYLPTGIHSVRVTWVNGEQDTFLQINELRLESLGGPDADNNGQADWIDSRLANTSQLDEGTLTSVLSPFTLEGQSAFYKNVSVSSDYEPDPQNPQTLTASEGLAGYYYCHIPLNPAADTEITVSESNGLSQFNKTVTWTPTNLLAVSESTVRVNDSLLLQVLHSSSASNDAITLNVFNDATGATVATYNYTASELVEHQFDAAGDFTLQADYLDEAGASAQVSMSVTVLDGSLASPPTVLNARTRNWYPTIDMDVYLEADTSVRLHESAPDNGQRVFRLGADGSGGRIVSRLGDEDGPIIDSAVVNQVVNHYKGTDYAYIIRTFPDGTELWSHTINVGGTIPADFSVEINVVKAGVTFDDGSIFRTVTATDFNEEGLYTFFLLRPPLTRGSACHRVNFYQGGEHLGLRY